MAYRQIPNTFTIAATSTPQPMLGSWITAGPVTKPAGSPITITLGTALTSGNDASMFVKGEQAYIIDPSGANGETVFVQSISGNTLTLGNSTDMSAAGGQNPVTRFSHVAGAIGTGSYIMPKQLCNNFLVMYESGGTGPYLYIGCSPTMTATKCRIFKLAVTTAGQSPTYYSSSIVMAANPFDTAEIFTFGTSGDAYMVSIVID